MQEIDDLNTNLTQLNRNFDKVKHKLKFNNQKKRTQMSAIDNKAKITTSKLGNVESKIEDIRFKID
jgi:flagellar biosynthesis chaperone FliJ